MGNMDELVEAYLSALDSTPLSIMAGDEDCSAKLSIEKTGSYFDVLWFEKLHHAELVLMNCQDDLTDIGAWRPDGSIDLSARAVRDYVVNVAAGLGASWRSEAEVREQASIAVEEIIERVEFSRQAGGLQQVNASYKIYRQSQIARGEKAVPYSVHLATFTRSLVTLMAQNANAR